MPFFLGKGRDMAVETIFAIAYFVCALLALVAHVARGETGRRLIGSFWARVGLVTGVFAILRLVSAHIFVERAMRRVSHDGPFPSDFRPGQLVMLLVLILVAVPLVGLFLYSRRRLPKAVLVGASALGVLILLAVAHSASLYMTGQVLQAKIGPLTISRLVEAAALALLAASCLAFARGSKGVVPVA